MTPRPRILCVIHHIDAATSLANAAIAAECGCDGVMLIQMDGRDHEVDEPAAIVKDRHPTLIVGANRLLTANQRAIERNGELGLDATWSDNAGLASRGSPETIGRTMEALSRLRRSQPGHLFFGGVAFKGQPQERDPAAAAETALGATHEPWIVTTSGVATGIAPDADKLRRMCAVTGRDRLAVASGISPENVAELREHVGWILAASAISRDFHQLDRDLTRRLVERATLGEG